MGYVWLSVESVFKDLKGKVTAHIPVLLVATAFCVSYITAADS